MDLALYIKSRLEELGLEQKDLAASAQVTESYISQLLARKKVPPLAGRTEIYARMSRFLKLPEDELSKMADLQRYERLRKLLRDQTKPLRPLCRELLLTKCASSRRKEVRVIFERDSFGELERLITQTFIGAAKQVDQNQAKESLTPVNSEPFNIPDEACAALLGSLVQGWDIDLRTFQINLTADPRLLRGGRKRFEFVETEPTQANPLEPGFRDFVADTSLSGDATQEELTFLRTLTFEDRQPTRIYYYRQLQNLRDPLNFSGPPNPRSSTTKKG